MKAENFFLEFTASGNTQKIYCDTIARIVMSEPDVISSYNNCLATIEDRKIGIADNVFEKILTLSLCIHAFSCQGYNCSQKMGKENAVETESPTKRTENEGE